MSSILVIPLKANSILELYSQPSHLLRRHRIHIFILSGSITNFVEFFKLMSIFSCTITAILNEFYAVNPEQVSGFCNI